MAEPMPRRNPEAAPTVGAQAAAAARRCSGRLASAWSTGLALLMMSWTIWAESEPPLNFFGSRPRERMNGCLGGGGILCLLLARRLQTLQQGAPAQPGASYRQPARCISE
jgi:hypothetical protein